MKTLIIKAGIIIFMVFNTPFADWAAHVIDDSFDGADGVRLGDVNNDGLMDITTGWEEAGVSSIYVHPGYDKVREKWPAINAGDTPDVEDAVFADLDGDGALDIISSCEGGAKRMYISWGPEDPADYMDASNWVTDDVSDSKDLTKFMFSVPLQVDGVNGLDFVAGGKGSDGAVGWFEAPANPRNVSDWKWHEIYPAGWTMSLITRDMDDDGDLDIVMSDRREDNQGVRWMENPGAGSKQSDKWENHFIGARDVEVMFMDMADLDGDGLEDAIVTERSDQNIVFFKRLDKSGLNWEPYEIDLPSESGRAKGICVGDVNGDGVPDIVSTTNTDGRSNQHGVVWLTPKIGVTDAKWDWHPISDTRERIFDRVELIDLDGDGDLDVLTADQGNYDGETGYGVVWFENPIDMPVSSTSIQNNQLTRELKSGLVKSQIMYLNSNYMADVKGRVFDAGLNPLNKKKDLK